MTDAYNHYNGETNGLVQDDFSGVSFNTYHILQYAI